MHVEVTCEVCGKPFMVPASTFNDRPNKWGKGRSRVRFCSKTCRDQSADIQARSDPELNRHRKLPPTDEVVQLYRDGMSTREIGERYRCTVSTVQKCLTDAGVEMMGRWRGYEMLPVDEIVRLYESGWSTTAIAKHFNVSTTPVIRRLKLAGIELRKSIFGGANPLRCLDGHVVRSHYERVVDDWLYTHEIVHAYEPALPFADTRRADFFARGIFIEIWGISGNRTYGARRRAKLADYASANLRVIGLYGRDIDQRLDTCLAPLLVSTA